MPRLLVVFVGSIILSASTAMAEQAFPYKAYVTADDVEVRSGPGEDFYPTDKLQKGETVEVYRRDAGGWCAIRPPEGSFSWISGRVLKLQDGNIAVVKEDDVASRVGSSLSNVRDVIQVRMHKGEAVELLDSKETPGGKSQVWYKIAPPSGEFRWISEKFLTKERPRDGLRSAGSVDSALGQDSSRDRHEAESDPRPSGADDKISSEQFQAELDRIDLELSMMVVEEPTVWSFDAMRIRGETLLDRADTAADRGKARLLLNKIARFEDIKQRYDSITAMREQNAVSNRFLAGLQRTMEKAAATADPDGQFDGVGQLQQVFSPKVGAPRYALVDEAGNVRYYVTPAPGVNLQNYVGRQVGITGTRGYMPEQRAQHITARHISSLETRIR
ncbi:MAG: SH3 domain-containing protein [Thermoguttaceae bacterium]